MTDTPKTPDKLLFVMRDKNGPYALGNAHSADSFSSSPNGVWQGIVGHQWPRLTRISCKIFEAICPHFKLKPGEGPIEVKPWPEVPIRTIVDLASEILTNECTDDIVDLAVMQAIEECLEFAKFFQEPTK